MNRFGDDRHGLQGVPRFLLACAIVLFSGCAAAPRSMSDRDVSFYCSGIEQREAESLAEEWLIQRYEGRLFEVLEWQPLYEGECVVMQPKRRPEMQAGCLLECRVRPHGALMKGLEEQSFRFLFREGRLIYGSTYSPGGFIIIDGAS